MLKSKVKKVKNRLIIIYKKRKMMKNVFIVIIFFMNVSLYSSVIKHNEIDNTKHVMQLAVFTTYEQTINLSKTYSNYELYIEKLDNYTLYIVNIKTEDKKELLSQIKKDFSDAFFIRKIVFFK